MVEEKVRKHGRGNYGLGIGWDPSGVLTRFRLGGRGVVTGWFASADPTSTILSTAQWNDVAQPRR